MTDELLFRARNLEATLRTLCEFDANIVRDLLAEVERLSAAAKFADESANIAILARQAAEGRLRELASAEPDAWQFQDRDGRWLWFTNDSHRENTMRDGSWPIRALIRRPEMPS